MKKKLNFRGLIANLVIGAFILSVSTELNAQEKKSTELDNFKIIVETNNNIIKLTSSEGTAWINLSFNKNNYQPQAIDEYGMTTLDKVSSKKDSNLADFLFTITKTENIIILKGIEGTWWSELKFSLYENQKQAFNKAGMTELN